MKGQTSEDIFLLVPLFLSFSGMLGSRSLIRPGKDTYFAGGVQARGHRRVKGDPGAGPGGRHGTHGGASG